MTRQRFELSPAAIAPHHKSQIFPEALTGEEHLSGVKVTSSTRIYERLFSALSAIPQQLLIYEVRDGLPLKLSEATQLPLCYYSV